MSGLNNLSMSSKMQSGGADAASSCVALRPDRRECRRAVERVRELRRDGADAIVLAKAISAQTGRRDSNRNAWIGGRGNWKTKRA